MMEFQPAKSRVDVSVGESVRILRELQELSQRQLSELTGISQATISAIENGRANLGVERAKGFGPGAQVPPGGSRFPGLGGSVRNGRVTGYRAGVDGVASHRA
jgi:transcriptional regulator with XRE-family HTH domain